MLTAPIHVSLGGFLLVLSLLGQAVAAEPPAKELFGAVATPSPAPTTLAIGSHAKGCLAGGTALPKDGPGWQAMRLSRNRIWAHPALIEVIQRLAATARADGWPGLLVGDIAQPRGGPMRTGHASHQIGLDADIWLMPMPNRTLTLEERETLSAVSVLRPGTREVDPALFRRAHATLIRRAAELREVARIFVHPGIKQALCASAGTDRAWLQKVRPWYGHDAHFHIRLACPPDQPLCLDQESPPPGDGCGDELAWWLGEEPWRTPAKPPTPPLQLADLPPSCATVLEAR